MFVEEKKQGEVQKSSDWDDFLSWLKTKNPEEKYEWCSPWKCPAGQYLDYRKRNTASVGLFMKISELAYCQPWTFGNLQRRLGL